MTNAVAICGVGMMTPVGLSASETAAAVRARTARFAESPLRDKMFEPITLAEVPADALPPLVPGLAQMPRLTARERRLLQLATRPLRECIGKLPAESAPIGLCLALPEVPTTRTIDSRSFLEDLAVQCGNCFDPRRSDASHVGRAGGFVAIGQAARAIQSGMAELFLAGGIDSYRDPYVLGTLDLEQRMKSSLNWDGFIPGEGAGFVLLASEGAAIRHGLRVLGRVSPLAVGFEAGHLYSPDPYKGDGLAATFQQLVASGTVEAPIAEVYSSMTGESHWAKEWGVAMMRTKAAFQEGFAMHHPADCFGETGAAIGPLMVGLAALGIRERYRRAPALAYGSSDRGNRAALVITA